MRIPHIQVGGITNNLINFTLKQRTMKNLKSFFVLIVLTVALYSCDSTVSIDDPKTETIEEIDMKTGEEGNEEDDRGGS